MCWCESDEDDDIGPPGGDDDDPGGGGSDPGGGGGGGDLPPPGPTPAPRPTLPPPGGLDPDSDAADGWWEWFCTCDDLPHYYIFTCPMCASGIRWVWPGNPDGAHSHFSCLESCDFPTPEPTPIRTPGGPAQDPTADEYPCENPPHIEAAYFTEDCKTQWEGGCPINVVVRIPDATVRVNPWTRSLNGLSTILWLEEVAEQNERWSGKHENEYCMRCNPGGLPSSGLEDDSYDCGGDTRVVHEGTRVNFELGVAWRRWSHGFGNVVFGDRPPAERRWYIPDRDWNGGPQTYDDVEYLEHTFETSSFPNDEKLIKINGPRWNPDCQEERCLCKDRIKPYPPGMAEDREYKTMASYNATLTHYWWPEWNMAWDVMECKDWDTSGCKCLDKKPKHTAGDEGCDCSGCEKEWCGRERKCIEWGFTHYEIPDGCPSNAIGPFGWCMHDLRNWGAPEPFMPWNGVGVGGGFTSRYPNQLDACDDTLGKDDCCPVYDKWETYIPIPVIEIQPGAPGWRDNRDD